jgi:hypothetical protein
MVVSCLVRLLTDMTAALLATGARIGCLRGRQPWKAVYDRDYGWLGYPAEHVVHGVWPARPARPHRCGKAGNRLSHSYWVMPPGGVRIYRDDLKSIPARWSGVPNASC